jgi:hypothetical protein
MKNPALASACLVLMHLGHVWFGQQRNINKGHFPRVPVAGVHHGSATF